MFSVIVFDFAKSSSAVDIFKIKKNQSDFGGRSRKMHAFVVYQIFCVCWNLANASPPARINFIPQYTVVPTGRQGGNDVLGLDASTSKSNVSMRSAQRSYGGLVVNNNELGKDFTKKMQLNAKKSSAEFAETESTSYGNNDVSAETVQFYNEVSNALIRHLIDCLHVRNNGTTKITMFTEFTKQFRPIEQNLLNSSIALLHQSGLDITRLMRLYLFFCGPYNEPERITVSAKQFIPIKYPEYNQRIRNIQDDIREKFEDISGDEHTESYIISTVEELQEVKTKTENELALLATRASNILKPTIQLLPSTPHHFVCIDLLKWTALMDSDNKDAISIQNSEIMVEHTGITMQRYAETLKYEIDIGNLDRLNYEVLLRVNSTFLSYVYKHFLLSVRLIDNNMPALKAYDQKTMSLVIARVYSIQPLLEVLHLSFVFRYLKYVNQLPLQTKLTALISYTDRFKMDSGLDQVRAVQEMKTRPDKTVKDINKKLNEFTVPFLQELNVKDSQTWIDGVNNELKKTPADISAAIITNKGKAQAMMALCLKQLNHNWPNTKI